MQNLTLFAAWVLIVNSILHFIQLPMYGMNNSVKAVLVFGLIYLVLGLLLFFKKAYWTLWTALVLVSFGAIGGLSDYMTSSTRVAMAPVFVLLDAVIFLCCIMAALKAKKLLR